MYGNWRINFTIAGAGSILVFLLALTNNLILPALLKAIYSFIAFLIVVYAMSFILSIFIFPKQNNAKKRDLDEEQSELSGQSIDIIAQQQDEDLNELLKQQLANSTATSNKQGINDVPNNNDELDAFKPLKPTQLFTNKSVKPEEMSKAIRHLTGE